MTARTSMLALFNRRFFDTEDTVNFELAMDGLVKVRGFGLTLSALFQPIVSTSSGRTLGWEGLVRPQDATGADITPLAFLDRFPTGVAMARADRVCRSLHLANFIGSAPEDAYLFVNLHPRHLLSATDHGTTFAGIAAEGGLAASRIVFEVQEHAARDEMQLVAAVKSFKSHGFLIALDGFGSGDESVQFDRLLELHPNIVKLHRQMLARRDPAHRYALTRLIRAVHQLGATVVATGIETPDDAALALDAGADMLQGYFVGRPHTQLLPGTAPRSMSPF